MSSLVEEKRFPYEEAHKIALRVLEMIRPHCIRAEIAGSIRRKKSSVGDIEIVAIPKPYETGLFESGIASVVNKWKKVRGELPCRYSQRMLPEGIALDLFFTEEDRWGLTLALRTGSSEYSHKVLANRWARLGYKSIDGYLTKEDEEGVLNEYEIREEKDLFEMLGIPYIEPELRNL